MGREPNSAPMRTVEIEAMHSGTQTVIDNGVREGGAAVFFARQGLDVYAIETFPAG